MRLSSGTLEEKYNIILELVQRKFARYLYKRQYGCYPYIYLSLFVYGKVGLETLCLRRKTLLLNTLPPHFTKQIAKYYRRAQTFQFVIVLPKIISKLLHRGVVRAYCTSQLLAHVPTIRTLHLISDLFNHCKDLDLFADNISVFCKNGISLYLIN